MAHHMTILLPSPPPLSLFVLRSSLFAFAFALASLLVASFRLFIFIINIVTQSHRCHHQSESFITILLPFVPPFTSPSALLSVSTPHSSFLPPPGRPHGDADISRCGEIPHRISPGPPLSPEFPTQTAPVALVPTNSYLGVVPRDSLPLFAPTGLVPSPSEVPLRDLSLG